MHIQLYDLLYFLINSKIVFITKLIYVTDWLTHTSMFGAIARSVSCVPVVRILSKTKFDQPRIPLSLHDNKTEPPATLLPFIVKDISKNKEIEQNFISSNMATMENIALLDEH